MSFRTTIILLVALVALGGFLFFSNRNQEEPDEDVAAVETISVLEVAAADVQAISITDSDGENVSVAQEDGVWRITAPEAEPADAAEVTRVISDIVSLTATRVITPTDDDRAPFGLAEPAYEVELVGEHGVLARLKVGSTNPSGNATYLQRADDASVIYLVDTFALQDVQGWLTAPPVPPTPTPVPAQSPTLEVTPTPALETTPPPTPTA